jgi:hypothetical protein
VFIDPPGDRPINRFINPENPLITCRVTRSRDRAYEDLPSSEYLHNIFMPYLPHNHIHSIYLVFY